MKNTFNDLNENHIRITWEELRIRFGFNVDYWKVEFRNYMGSRPRNFTDLDGFMIFGNKRINPILNQILGRTDLHPTFNRLVSYIILTK